MTIYILFISQMNMVYADSFTLQSAHSLYAIKEAKRIDAPQLIRLIQAVDITVFNDDANSYIIFPVTPDGFHKPYRVQKSVIEELQNNKHMQKYLNDFREVTKFTDISFYNAVNSKITHQLFLYDAILIFAFLFASIVVWGIVMSTGSLDLEL